MIFEPRPLPPSPLPAYFRPVQPATQGSLALSSQYRDLLGGTGCQRVSSSPSALAEAEFQAPAGSLLVKCRLCLRAAQLSTPAPAWAISGFMPDKASHGDLRLLPAPRPPTSISRKNWHSSVQLSHLEIWNVFQFFQDFRFSIKVKKFFLTDLGISRSSFLAICECIFFSFL